MPSRNPSACLVLCLGILSVCAAKPPFSRKGKELPPFDWGDVALIASAEGDAGTPARFSRLEGTYPPFLPYRLFQALINAQAKEHRDRTLRNPDFAERVVPFVYCAEYGSSRVLGTTESFLDLKTGGHPIGLQTGHWAAAESEMVIGHAVAVRDRVQLGETFLIQPWTGTPPGHPPRDPIALTVTGILRPLGNAWDRGMFTNLDAARDILTQGGVWSNGVLHFIAVQLREGGVEDLRKVVGREVDTQAVVYPATVKRGPEKWE
jgi:hypothetical protein